MEMDVGLRVAAAVSHRGGGEGGETIISGQISTSEPPVTQKACGREENAKFALVVC